MCIYKTILVILIPSILWVIQILLSVHKSRLYITITNIYRLDGIDFLTLLRLIGKRFQYDIVTAGPIQSVFLNLFIVKQYSVQYPV